MKAHLRKEMDEQINFGGEKQRTQASKRTGGNGMGGVGREGWEWEQVTELQIC
jgi:hypothetical protein